MNKNQEEYFTEIIEFIKKKKPSKDKLSRIKNKLAKKHKLSKPPTDIEILLNAKEKDLAKIKKILLTKPTRSISGVEVIAVMSKPFKCPHGKCITCPGGPESVFGDVPQSYTGKEPATRRAIRNNYDPYLQIFNRLEQYVVTGHNFDKIELIIMGGTFPSFSKRYKESYIMNCYKAMNDFSKLFFNNKKFNFKKFKEFFELPGNINDENRINKIHHKVLKIKNKRKSNIEKEQKINEKSDVRCIGLTIETRPDYAKLKHAKEMLKFGCTRIELGIQTIYDDVLKKIKRGHSIEDSIKSIKILKDLGFKLNFHMMLGLPNVTYDEDVMQILMLFQTNEFQPDMLKLYPCMVMKGTKLYNLYKKKEFKPLTTKKAIKMIKEIKQFVPEYCRIMRVQRDIPTFMTEAGVNKTNLRQLVHQEMEKEGLECRCIRCREIKNKKPRGKININVIHYGSSDGNEFFIQAEKGDCLLGFCRLRFPSQSLTKEINLDSALIRELHVYGTAEKVDSKKNKNKKDKKTQHTGVGKLLLKEAEKTCKTYWKNKVVVISGVGVREYYKKLGYKKEGPYMIKKLR